MFKSGDCVYVIDEYYTNNLVTYGMIIGDIGEYYILYEQADKDIVKNAVIEKIYREYIRDGEINVVMAKKTNTFATEQEAREALEVMSGESIPS